MFQEQLSPGKGTGSGAWSNARVTLLTFSERQDDYEVDGGVPPERHAQER